MESELIVSAFFRVKVCQDCHRGRSQQLWMFGCGFLGPGQVDSHVGFSALHTHTYPKSHTQNDKPARNTHIQTSHTITDTSRTMQCKNIYDSIYSIHGEAVGLHVNEEAARRCCPLLIWLRWGCYLVSLLISFGAAVCSNLLWMLQTFTLQKNRSSLYSYIYNAQYLI